MGLNPTRGVLFFFFRPSNFFGTESLPACCDLGVPVAQLDKASDYESEDWGFKSLQGYVFIFFCNPALRDRCCIYLAVWTLADIAQLGERQTEDLKVPGSIPGVGNFLQSP